MHAFLKTGKLGAISSNRPDTIKKKAAKPWVEKYRPKKITDVAEQDEVVTVLSKVLNGADLPNLLFYGAPGTGKTSTILAAARELFGNELFHQRVLELNASDERGIQVVREKVKTFAQNTVSSVRSDGTPCPSFKLIILDEADSMTHAAQAALRRTMEKQSKSTRFCLICNYVSRIIEPLTSRCSKFRFKPLGKTILQERLHQICKEEGVKVSDEGIDSLISVSEGDMRRAITTLQSAARLQTESGLTQQIIYDITGVVQEKWLTGLLDTCAKGNYDELSKYLDELMAEGYAGGQILLQIHDHIIERDSFTDDQKCCVMEKLGICDHKLLEGADEYLQLMDFCSCLMQTMKRK